MVDICSYSYSIVGWFSDSSQASGLQAGYPFAYVRPGCANVPGIRYWDTDTTKPYSIFCKVNSGEYI